jgi:hypothetical protein
MVLKEVEKIHCGCDRRLVLVRGVLVVMKTGVTGSSCVLGVWYLAATALARGVGSACGMHL